MGKIVMDLILIATFVLVMVALAKAYKGSNK